MPSPLCKYKHIFGEERRGVHSWRLFDIAIVDLLATVSVAALLTFVIKKTWWMFFLILGGLLVLGIIVHRLFCVNTKINMMIFGRI